MKKKTMIAGLAALTLTASLSGLTVSAENEVTVPEDNSAYEMQLPEVTESSEDTATSFDGTSYTSGDFTYTLDNASAYATITAYNGTSANVVIPDTVNGYPVKKLADGLFKGNTKITSVRVDCTQLKILPYECFSGCTNLESVSLNNGIEEIYRLVFAGCTKLTSVNIPEGVKIIYGQAFENCSSLPSITFPSTLEAIKTYETNYIYGAFEGCTSLSTVTFTPGTKDASIGKETFAGTAITSLNLPKNYTSIGDGAFADCKKLTTVTSTGGIKTISYRTFIGCSSLETVTLNDGLEVIGRAAFSGCQNLRSINIPEGVTTIYGQAFENCSSLPSITLPSTLEAIKTHETNYVYGAFEGCTSLSTVTFTPGTKDASIGKEAFAGTAITSLNLPKNYTTISQRAFADCTKLTTVTSIGGIKTIPYQAFIGCSSLKSVTLNEGLEVIGGRAFENCSSLTSITFPSTLQKIESYETNYIYGAFEGCTSLSTITFTPGTKDASIGKETFAGSSVVALTIPSNYTSIGQGAFANCKKLEIVYFENGTTDVTLGSSVFSGCTTLKHAVLSKNVTSIGDKAFSNCKLATVVSCDETAFQTNTFTGVKANVKYNTFNGRANVTAIATEAEKVVIPCIISGYPTSAQMPSSFVGNAVVDHLYYGNNCYLCGTNIRPKPTATPGNESITLSWTPINSASKYAVFNYYNGDFAFVAEVDDSAYTMANLNAGETYGFALAAFNNGKWTELNPEDVVYATPEGSAVNAFVDRLYTIILGRGAEPAGLADWTNRLTSGTATSAEIVYGIAGSQEFQEKNYANDVIVEKMYNAMLGRGSDPAGKENWVSQLNAGMSFNAIINGFSGSQEFAQVCAGYGILPGNISQIEPRDVNAGLTAFVSRMYTKALGRGYDVNGLNDWTGSYLNGTATTADIAYGFIFSKEFTEKNYTDEQYVDILYSTFFDRAPDEGGKQNWLNDLANGKSREHVLNGFLGSKEFLDLAASFGV